MEMIEAVTLILGVLLALLFIIPRFNKPSQSKTEALNSNTKNISKESRRYTKAEVSLHDKRTDCWVIIKDKVYDVTSYVEEHPGGDAILTHAGDDSTEGFYGFFEVPNFQYQCSDHVWTAFYSEGICLYQCIDLTSFALERKLWHLHANGNA